MATNGTEVEQTFQASIPLPLGQRFPRGQGPVLHLIDRIDLEVSRLGAQPVHYSEVRVSLFGSKEGDGMSPSFVVQNPFQGRFPDLPLDTQLWVWNHTQLANFMGH